LRGYYSEKLSAERLRRVYDIAPPRVKQYLQAEIDFVLNHIRPGDRVLELGCGYGRVLEPLAHKAALTAGIDTSHQSLVMARNLTKPIAECCQLAEMDASRLGFRDNIFDVVVCIQNGISAFKVDQRQLIAEAVRVTRPGGKALFSSYSDKFWEHRLEWFELQAQHGLLGEIDYSATGDGVIVCKDGFRATTFKADEFARLAQIVDARCLIVEVDESSLFCVLTVR
jgi:ubiquinone/menaquinone biosynthesis C-methylase UbiE